MIALHAWEPRSRANGPGARFVLWFQGCSLGCAGCFNPATHDPAASARHRLTVDEVVAMIAATPRIEGITLSGGEPMQQPEAALALLERVRAEPTLAGLSTLAFSGYTIEEIRSQPLGAHLLAHLDVLIDGRYRAGERSGVGLRGSTNQRVHLLSARYTQADVAATPVTELRITAEGAVIATGVDPLKLKL